MKTPLKRDWFAETRRDGDRVVKISRLVPWLAEHEWKIYKRLDGVRGVPRALERGGNWFSHAWAPGRPLSTCRPPRGFYADLARLLCEIHARGVAYNDLSKRANVIVGDDGRAHLVDFQISTVNTPWLQREDWDHFHKLAGLERRKSALARLHERLVRRPYLRVRRLFVAHGAGEPGYDRAIFRAISGSDRS